MHQMELNLDSHGALDGRWKFTKNLQHCPLSSHYLCLSVVICHFCRHKISQRSSCQLSGTLRGGMTQCLHFIIHFILYATVRVSCDLILFVQDLSVTYFGGFYFRSVVFECVGGRAGSADSP